MSTESNTPTKQLPAFRICYAPYENGQKSLELPVEIGSCWPRKDPTKGYVAKLKIVPENMKENGVLLIMPPQVPRNEELAV